MEFDGFEDFVQDKNLENGEGIDIRFPNGAVIIIHRAGGANKKYARLVRQKMKPYKWQLDRGTMDEEVAERLMREIYAESVIIGWRGVKAGGEDVMFTEKNCVDFLEAFPTIFEKIQEVASDAANFKLERMQEDAETLGN